MIERLYQRARGMAKVSRRLFSPVREPGLPVAWAATVCDPFVLLENGLARIIDVTEQTQPKGGDASTSEYRRRPMGSKPGFSPSVAEPIPIATQESSADRQTRYTSMPQFSRRELSSLHQFPATERSSVEQAAEPLSALPEGKQRPMENVFVSRQGTRPAVFPQFTYSDSAHDENETPSRAENGNRRNGAVFPRQLSSPSSTISHGVPQPQKVWDAAPAEDEPTLSGHRQTNACPVVAPAPEPTRKSRLVQTCGLIHLLKTNTEPRELPEFSSAAPAAFHEGEVVPGPAPPGSRSAPAALTVDALLDELEDRLRFEFLRTYGSSGE